ncbi:TatD family hydrolase [Aliikangiella sp. G2MR2-5]|uniref:TatD family hydrolase n=1 Tax=Aliikangiella sp. G2MR2-5 TaxID=2788943 RepID=UPI0018AAF37E|nr:TatD family hydrolase [Aliikangiella sp. G2MR2-5]
MKWVDIGINLTNKRFDSDRDQVIASALAAGVDKLIITGTNLAESKKALQIASSDIDGLYCTAGCHPHDAGSFSNEALNEISAIAEEPEVVAIGECGLDFNRDFSPRHQQINAFERQLELAVKLQKPVFLHERDAFDTQYQILKDYIPKLKGGVAHCFTGTIEAMEAYLELGLSIGITGWICDERRGQALYDMVHLIPDNRLMIETDGPYLTPRDLRPKPKDGRNEPKYLPHIGEAVARAREQSLHQVAENSYNNSCKLFNLE